MLYYQEFGAADAPALVLLHSGGLAGVEWQPQIAALSSRYRLIIPDLPGHGASPLDVPTLTLEHIVASVLALLDRLHISSFYLCGSSLGGASALALALQVPERVKRLVVYRISYRKNAATYAQTRQMATPAYWAQFGLAGWLSQLHEPQGGPEAWKTVIGRVSEALNPALGGHNHSLDDLRRLNMPVLLIAGDRDPVAPLADILAMYEALPAPALWIMPAASHITASNTWRAAAFAEELKRFFSLPQLPPKLENEQ